MDTNIKLRNQFAGYWVHSLNYNTGLIVIYNNKLYVAVNNPDTGLIPPDNMYVPGGYINPDTGYWLCIGELNTINN